MSKLKIAIIGLGHVHTQILFRLFNQYPDEVEWLGMADMEYTPAEKTQQHIQLNAGEARDLPLCQSYHELLKKEPDLVLCGSGIKDHLEVGVAALNAGASVILEKPMAMNFEDASALYQTHRKSKGELIVNWPVAWFTPFRKAKALAAEGKVGRIVRFQYRTPATLGPYSTKGMGADELKNLWWYQREQGGGSIMDYAGYSAALSTWFLQDMQAKTVYGIKKNIFIPFSDAEDYSFFMADYGDAVALMEGSWSTVSSGEIPTGPIVYGTKGTLVCDRFSDEVKVYLRYVPYKTCQPPDEIYRMEPLEDNLGRNVLDHLCHGAPLFEMLTADFNIRAAAVLDAGRMSCDTGKPEQVKQWGGN
jgi:predicted dehydrogenase